MALNVEVSIQIGNLGEAFGKELVACGKAIDLHQFSESTNQSRLRKFILMLECDRTCQDLYRTSTPGGGDLKSDADVGTRGDGSFSDAVGYQVHSALKRALAGIETADQLGGVVHVRLSSLRKGTSLNTMLAGEIVAHINNQLERQLDGILERH